MTFHNKSIIDNLIKAKAAGHLLTYYHSDLLYISNFQNFKRRLISTEEFINNEKGSLRSFISDYRIARNLKGGVTFEFAEFIRVWVNKGSEDECNNVDDLALSLNKLGFTHSKLMTSLSSKILMLNNPWEILPMDSHTRKAIGQRSNNYSDYKFNIEQYKERWTTEIEATIAPIKSYLDIMEEDYTSEISDLGIIRKNRLLDKLLWVIGEGMTNP